MFRNDCSSYIHMPPDPTSNRWQALTYPQRIPLIMQLFQVELFSSSILTYDYDKRNVELKE